MLTPVPGATSRYDDDGNEIVEVMTCGHCGRSWNDAAVSSVTPVPSGRCPFEYEHEYDDDDSPKARLEYLRGEINNERISMSEVAELQGLAEHIDPSDVQLLEWAGVPEHPEEAASGRFTIAIDVDGDAFQPDPSGELARLLRGIADRIESGGQYAMFETIHDVNGNTCGQYALKPHGYR